MSNFWFFVAFFVAFLSQYGNFNAKKCWFHDNMIVTIEIAILIVLGGWLLVFMMCRVLGIFNFCCCYWYKSQLIVASYYYTDNSERVSLTYQPVTQLLYSTMHDGRKREERIMYFTVSPRGVGRIYCINTVLVGSDALVSIYRSYCTKFWKGVTLYGSVISTVRQSVV